MKKTMSAETVSWSTIQIIGRLGFFLIHDRRIEIDREHREPSYIGFLHDDILAFRMRASMHHDARDVIDDMDLHLSIAMIRAVEDRFDVPCMRQICLVPAIMADVILGECTLCLAYAAEPFFLAPTWIVPV